MQNRDIYPTYPIEIDGVGRGILQNPQQEDEQPPAQENQTQDDKPQGEVKHGRIRKHH